MWRKKHDGFVGRKPARKVPAWDDSGFQTGNGIYFKDPKPNGTSVATVPVGSTNNTPTGIATPINNQTAVVHASVTNDANGAHLDIVNVTADGELQARDSANESSSRPKGL